MEAMPRLAAARALLLAAFLSFPPAHAAELTPAQRTADFDARWRAVDTGYAYFGRARDAVKNARAADRRRAASAPDRDGFVAALENSLARLRDEHATLSERSRQGPRRVPSETDIWPAWLGR